MNSFTANPIKTVKPIRWIGALQGLRAIAFLAFFLFTCGVNYLLIYSLIWVRLLLIELGRGNK